MPTSISALVKVLVLALELLVFMSTFEISKVDAYPNTLQSFQLQVDQWAEKQAGGNIAVAVVSASKTEFLFGGKMDFLPNEHTIFEIGSITKGFTGLLLAVQVLSGNVFLNDTLAKLITDWPGRFSAPPGNVTLLELTTHSAGFTHKPDNLKPAPIPDNPYANYTVAKLYSWLDKTELLNRGSYLYSNGGIGCLGHALELNQRKHYQDLLKERVLLPLGLKDTTITLDSDQKRRLAAGHDINGQKMSNWDFDVLAPAAALRSTVSDLAQFLRVACGLEPIQDRLDEALDLSFRPLRNTTMESTTIGFCWFQSKLPRDNVVVWHKGDTGGYSSYIGWVSDKQIGIIVLASITAGSNNTADELGLNLLKLKLGL